MQRRILGISAIVFLLAAGAIWLWWPGPGMEVELAFFSRMGAVLVAAWLAYEDVQRLPGWILLTLPVVLVVLARWPRLLLLLIPALVVWVILQRVLSSGKR
jgi:hypothetical protein